MNAFFITGTDTNVGKTIVSAWLCAHLKADYWKPIQTGADQDSDSDTIKSLSPRSFIHKEFYLYKAPLSPHLAATLEGSNIDLNAIQLPNTTNILLIEGAGGLYVPLNDHALLIDLIAKLNVPVILVARSTLGTINHTCLSIAALRDRQIPLLGVIMNGPENQPNKEAIEKYGHTKVLAQCPQLNELSSQELLNHPLPDALKKALRH